MEIEIMQMKWSQKILTGILDNIVYLPYLGFFFLLR